MRKRMMINNSRRRQTKKRKPLRTILLIFFFVLIVIICWPKSNPTIDQSIIKESVALDYQTDYNYRMTGNHCGPYSVAAVYRILKHEDIKSYQLYQESKYKVGSRGNLPRGIQNLLKKYGISYDIHRLGNLSDDKKISYLQQELSVGRPIIILGGRNTGGPAQHYITLVGFDRQEDIFYTYDSRYMAGEIGHTADGNGELPGNRNFTTEELLGFWGGGGMFGLYKWYAVSCYL